MEDSLEDLQTSLTELSRELQHLGLKPLVCLDVQRMSDVCEAVMNGAWLLVQLIHKNTVTTNVDKHRQDREQILQSELERSMSKLSRMSTRLQSLENTLAQVKNESKLRESKCHLLQQENKEQAKQLFQLKSKLKRCEDMHKTELTKNAFESEKLRCTVRKMVCQGKSFSETVFPEASFANLQLTNETEIPSTDLSKDEEKMRMVLTNEELISENLMLRDVLRSIHAELDHLIQHPTGVARESQAPDGISSSIFHLPLSRCKEALIKLQREKVEKLQIVITEADK